MVQKAKALTEIDLRHLIEKIREKYRLDVLPRVVAADYDDEGGTLFMRFSHNEIVQSEPTEDGLLLLHYSKAGDLTAIEIIDLAKMV